MRWPALARHYDLMQSWWMVNVSRHKEARALGQFMESVVQEVSSYSGAGVSLALLVLGRARRPAAALGAALGG